MAILYITFGILAGACVGLAFGIISSYKDYSEMVDIYDKLMGYIQLESKQFDTMIEWINSFDKTIRHINDEIEDIQERLDLLDNIQRNLNDIQYDLQQLDIIKEALWTTQDVIDAVLVTQQNIGKEGVPKEPNDIPNFFDSSTFEEVEGEEAPFVNGND